MPHRIDALFSFAPVVLAGLFLALFAVMQATPAAIDSLARALDSGPPAPARPAPLVWAGLYLDRLMAGAAGGYVHMMRAARQGTDVWSWARAVVAGAVMGNYLPSVLGVLVPALGTLPEPATLGGSFALGYIGFAALARLERGVADAPSAGEAPPPPPP